MCEFSEEGTLERDLTNDPLIPKDLSSVSYSVQNAKIYTAKKIDGKGEEGWKMAVFNGHQWSTL